MINKIKAEIERVKIGLEPTEDKVQDYFDKNVVEAKIRAYEECLKWAEEMYTKFRLECHKWQCSGQYCNAATDAADFIKEQFFKEGRNDG